VICLSPLATWLLLGPGVVAALALAAFLICRNPKESR
jgi:hypothetical protein